MIHEIENSNPEFRDRDQDLVVIAGIPITDILNFNPKTDSKYQDFYPESPYGKFYLCDFCGWLKIQI